MCLNIKHIYFAAVQIVVLNVVGSSPTCHPSIAKRPRAFPGRFFVSDPMCPHLVPTRFSCCIVTKCCELFVSFFEKPFVNQK